MTIEIKEYEGHKPVFIEENEPAEKPKKKPKTAKPKPEKK